MTKSLSIPQARKLVLLSQRLPPTGRTGTAAAATLTAIEHLGYIQIDTISVIQQAHHHTLESQPPLRIRIEGPLMVRDFELGESLFAN